MRQTYNSFAKRSPSRWKDLFYENGSYKVVALFVTLVLWMTILGRRDRVMTEEINLRVMVSSDYEFIKDPSTKVRLKLSGSGPALKKFQKAGDSISLNADIRHEGRNMIRINKDEISVPLGVKILEIDPDQIEIDVKRVPKRIDVDSGAAHGQNGH